MAKACIPETIDAGTTLTVRVESAEPGVQYALLLRGPSSQTFDAVNGVITVEAGVTSGFVPGIYAYALRANSPNGAVAYVQRGRLEVTPDFASIADGHDVRTAEEIALAAINAVLQNRATRDQQRYKINNRELERMQVSDLIKLRSLYVRLVRRQRGGLVIREHSVKW